MKIIKSLLPIILFLCCTSGLKAQNNKTESGQHLKTEIAKPAELKLPANNNSQPSPAPVFTPQPQVSAVATEVTEVAADPSPSTRKEEAKPEIKESQEARTFNKNDISTPGGEEGRKIMNGNASTPKDPVFSPSTIDPKQAPPVEKPAVSKSGRQE